MRVTLVHRVISLAILTSYEREAELTENERIGEKDVENGYLSIFIHHRILL